MGERERVGGQWRLACAVVERYGLLGAALSDPCAAAGDAGGGGQGQQQGQGQGCAVAASRGSLEALGRAVLSVVRLKTREVRVRVRGSDRFR